MTTPSTPSGRKLAALLALSVVLLAPSDCTVDVGNLGDYIVTHEITVTNSATDDALIWIAGSGLKRRSVLKPGASVTATAYAGDNVLVSAAPGRDVLADLKAKRDAVAHKLAQVPFDLTASMSVYNELSLYNSMVRDYEQGAHGQVCSAGLNVDDKGKGNSVTAVVTLDGDQFRVSCEF